MASNLTSPTRRVGQPAVLRRAGRPAVLRRAGRPAALRRVEGWCAAALCAAALMCMGGCCAARSVDSSSQSTAAVEAARRQALEYASADSLAMRLSLDFDTLVAEWVPEGMDAPVRVRVMGGKAKAAADERRAQTATEAVCDTVSARTASQTDHREHRSSSPLPLWLLLALLALALSLKLKVDS